MTTPQNKKCNHGNEGYCLACYNESIGIRFVSQNDNWKDEFEIFVKEWSEKNTVLATNHKEMQNDLKDFISSLLSSQAHALKGQMKACIPDKKDIQIPLTGTYMGPDKGFNDCREQTLSALNDL